MYTSKNVADITITLQVFGVSEDVGTTENVRWGHIDGLLSSRARLSSVTIHLQDTFIAGVLRGANRPATFVPAMESLKHQLPLLTSRNLLRFGELRVSSFSASCMLTVYSHTWKTNIRTKGCDDRPRREGFARDEEWRMCSPKLLERRALRRCESETRAQTDTQAKIVLQDTRVMI